MIRYQLILRPLDDDSDPRGIRRLRACLKNMLRGYRLRCTRVVEVQDEDTDDVEEAVLG